MADSPSADSRKPAPASPRITPSAIPPALPKKPQKSFSLGAEALDTGESAIVKPRSNHDIHSEHASGPGSETASSRATGPNSPSPGTRSAIYGGRMVMPHLKNSGSSTPQHIENDAEHRTSNPSSIPPKVSSSSYSPGAGKKSTSSGPVHEPSQAPGSKVVLKQKNAETSGKALLGLGAHSLSNGLRY